MARRSRGGGGGRNDNSFYKMVGTFAIIFLAYLWIGPKLIKKPAGTPPRSGSNEEQKQAARVVNGMPPQPVTATPSKIPGSATPDGRPKIMGFGPLPASTTIPNLQLSGAYPARMYPNVRRIHMA